jgi:hypothetical protein
MITPSRSPVGCEIIQTRVVKMQHEPLSYARAPRKRHRPWRFTLIFSVVGILALALLRLANFLGGGPDVAWLLFPLADPLVKRLDPRNLLPVAGYYLIGFGQWFVIGGVLDLLRALRSRIAQRKPVDHFNLP